MTTPQKILVIDIGGSHVKVRHERPASTAEASFRSRVGRLARWSPLFTRRRRIGSSMPSRSDIPDPLSATVLSENRTTSALAGCAYSYPAAFGPEGAADQRRRDAGAWRIQAWPDALPRGWEPVSARRWSSKATSSRSSWPTFRTGKDGRLRITVERSEQKGPRQEAVGRVRRSTSVSGPPHRDAG